MDDDGAPVPGNLLERLRADPARAPETLALAAADVHGPAAAAWLADKQALYSYDGPALAKMAKKRHAALARFGGAATGFGGALTMLPDLAALAWIQSRMVFFIAGAFGFDPLDRMRPAELLVLQELYPDPLQARTALDGAGTTIAEAFVDTRASGDKQLLERLARMAGAKAAQRLAGKAIPGFAVVFNAVTNERDTRALGDRAIRFYGG